MLNCTKQRNEKFSYSTLMIFLLSSVVLIMAGCGSSDSSDNKVGYLKFYNSSTNAPSLFLTVDENLDEDEDDEVEITFSGTAYGTADTRRELPTGDYFYELAWQDEDSAARADLEMIFQDQISIEQDTIKFVVASGDISQPQVNVYDISLVDDEDDSTLSLFNLRVLNMHGSNQALDIYLSQTDETFNEATMIGSYSFQELSENQKFDQDQYVFYITHAGEDEVLFQSNNVSFLYPSQYVMVIRENIGNSDSPYIIDKVSSSYTETFLDYNAEAHFRVFNAIDQHELIADYNDAIDVEITGGNTTSSLSSLERGTFSDEIVKENGDFSVKVTVSDSETILLNNHLLSLPENANKTLFLYLTEDNVDHDGDGDVDENGDGIVDEIEISINSLVVDNSVRESIYDHQLQLVNLVDSDDFGVVEFYFVRSDETIATAYYSSAVSYANAESIILRNNTYQVFAVAKHNSSEIVLANFELTLDENSDELFLIIEQDDTAASGYRVTTEEQL
ncbi:hypothetical protein [Thalassotalea sp. PP2-459]|uniref:hypothetical protein n=1 Tax=Thalassotalea sp. PP2-459 TaxID=1742724 RepID=UPI00094535AF|nr:hypothetical protein [Thalassotalea sp. PP2-459]